MNELQLFFQSHFTFLSIIEILILTFLIYQAFKLIGGTQAERVVRGLIVILLLVPISDLFGLTTITFLIRSIFTWLFILIIIVFQPELRLALERLGNHSFLGLNFHRNRDVLQIEKTINTLIESIQLLQASKTGALIVCEDKTGLRNIEVTGTVLNARISPELIMNIFYDKAPLHDGAAIISIDQDLVLAAGCVLPLTNRTDIPNNYGMRHRAGIGISEHSDALTIIVSEETGQISYTQNYNFYEEVQLEELKKVLLQTFVESYSRIN